MVSLSSQAVKMIKSRCKHKFLRTKLNVLPTVIKTGNRSKQQCEASFYTTHDNVLEAKPEKAVTA
jgi:hypothetical protein